MRPPPDNQLREQRLLPLGLISMGLIPRFLTTPARDLETAGALFPARLGHAWAEARAWGERAAGTQMVWWHRAPGAPGGSLLTLSRVLGTHKRLEGLSAPWREHRESHTAKPGGPVSDA